jgi:hypothetical protein
MIRSKIALIAIALVGCGVSLAGVLNLYDHFRGTPASSGEHPYLYGHLTVESCVIVAGSEFNCMGSFRQHGGDMPSISSMVRVDQARQKGDLIEVFGKYDAFKPDSYGPGETPTHAKLRSVHEWRTVKHSSNGILLTTTGAVLVFVLIRQLMRIRHKNKKVSN